MIADPTDLSTPATLTRRIKLRERQIVGTVLTALVLFRVWLLLDHWYRADAFYFLQLSPTIHDLFTPRGPHPSFFNVLSMTTLTSWFDFSALPFNIIGGVAMASFFGLWWRVLRSRGTPTAVALAALVLMATLDISAWFEGWFIGNMIGHATIQVTGFMLTQEPTKRKRILLAIVLFAGGIGHSLGLFAVGIATLIVFGFHSKRPWWPSLISGWVAVAIYLRFREAGTGGLELSALADIPYVFVELTSAALEKTLFLPAWAGLMLIGILVGMTIWKKDFLPFDAYDFTVAVALLLFVAGLVIFRSDGADVQPFDRHLVSIAILLASLTVPRATVRSVPKYTKVMSAVLIALGLWAVPQNIQGLTAADRNYAFASAQLSRLLAAEAALIANGEFANPATSSGAPNLSVAGLTRLVERGIVFPHAPNPTDSERARGQLRILTGTNAPPSPDATCIHTVETIVVRPLSQGRFSVESAERYSILLHTQDGFGRYDRLTGFTNFTVISDDEFITVDPLGTMPATVCDVEIVDDVEAP